VNAFAPRLDALPAAQRALWPELAVLRDRFVLYGGTAVALRHAHRVSADFDFFSADPVEPLALFGELPFATGSVVLQAEADTLTISVDRGAPVKVSLFGGLSFGRIEDPDITDDGVARIASPVDLASTKLAVLLRRVEPRDYHDVAVLLRGSVTLPRALGGARALYGPAFSPVAALKALAYFEGADFSSVPRAELDWLAAASAAVTAIDDVSRVAPVLSS
jgi:hypothetical protein